MTPSSTVPGCGGNTIDIVPIYPLVLIINTANCYQSSVNHAYIINRVFTVLATLHRSVQSISVCRSVASPLSVVVVGEVFRLYVL
jgi:hypothetical protein